MDDNTLQLLVEAQLIPNKQSQHPTEDFMIKVLTNFCTKMNIDINAIQKPIFHQLQLDHHVELMNDNIKLINLQAAMSEIFSHIFLKDFSINDISRPNNKRASKILKVLSNFCLYYYSRINDIVGRRNELYERYNTIEDLNQQLKKVKQEIIEITAKKGHMSTESQQFSKHLEKLQSGIHIFEGKKTKLEAKIIDTQVKCKETIQTCGTYKVESSNLCKNILNMESKIVKSPEKHKAKLEALDKTREDKNQHREKLRVDIVHKKKMYETIDEKKNSVLQLHQHLNEYYIKKFEEFQESVKDKENLEKELKEKESTIQKKEAEQQDISEQKQCHTVEIEILKTNCKKELLPLNKERDDLFREKKLCGVNAKQRCEMYSKIKEHWDNIKSQVEKQNSEIQQHLKEFEEFYNLNVKEDIELEKLVDKYLKQL